MQITGELVQYLEKLGRIQLTPEQEQATEKDLQEILSYMSVSRSLPPEYPSVHSRSLYLLLHLLLHDVHLLLSSLSGSS